MEPEVAQRIAELERQLAEAMAAAQAEERGSAQSAQALDRIVELTAELGQILQTDPQSLPSVEMPERAEVFGGVVAESPYLRSAEPSRRIPVRIAILLIVVIGCLGVAAVWAIYANRGGDTNSAADSDDIADAVTTVPRGGQLRVGADLGAKKMVACNDGHLTLYGTGIFTVTGHCVSLTTGATRSQVSVEHADAINVTGFDSEYFIAADCAGLTVTADGNEVHVGSVDAVNIAGDDNTVIYKSGSPEVADAGDGNVVAEREVTATHCRRGRRRWAG